MKTVLNHGTPKKGATDAKGPTTLRFQYGGVFNVLPKGESEWDDAVATFLARQFRGVGVRIVPSEIEARADRERQEALIARRTEKRPKNRAEARKEAIGRDQDRIRLEGLKDFLAAEAAAAAAIPTPEVVPEPELVQPEHPAEGPNGENEDAAETEHP
jgi:hypothetical protein